MFQALFGTRAGCDNPSGEADKLYACLQVDAAGDRVFHVWSCLSASSLRATVTLIFDADNTGILQILLDYVDESVENNRRHCSSRAW